MMIASSMDCNERVSFTPMTSGNGIKRSHPPSSSDDEREGAYPPDTDTCSDEETHHAGRNHKKAPRMMNDLDHSYATLLQGLDSPHPEAIWKQDGMGAVNQGFCTSPLQASMASMEQRGPPMTQREGHPVNEMLPRSAFSDPQGRPWTLSPEAVDENGTRRHDQHPPEVASSAYPPMMMHRESHQPHQPMNTILPRQQAYTDAQGRPWTYSPERVDENGYHAPNHMPAQPQLMPNNGHQPPDQLYAYYPYPNGGYGPPPPIVGYVYDPKPPPLHNPYGHPPAGQPLHPLEGGPGYHQQQFPPAPYPPPYHHQQGAPEPPAFQRKNSHGSHHSSGSGSSGEDGTGQAKRMHHQPVLLHSDRDDDILSDYQIFLRKQIEFFEADRAEVKTATPGRKVPVVLGQVGIRCIHCAHVPIQQRASATAYFPSRLKGLYQAAQNIGTTHFRKSCPNIPPDQQELAKTAFQVNGKRATAGHGGKKYWADSAASFGIVESENGLQFSTS